MTDAIENKVIVKDRKRIQCNKAGEQKEYHYTQRMIVRIVPEHVKKIKAKIREKMNTLNLNQLEKLADIVDNIDSVNDYINKKLTMEDITDLINADDSL